MWCIHEVKCLVLNEKLINENSELMNNMRNSLKFIKLYLPQN